MIQLLSLECPAGLIDEGETPMQAVIRELREETGLIVSENMISQVSDNTYFSCGMMTHKISVFTCECDSSNVKEGIYSHDKDEYIKTRLVSYDSLREKLT